MTYLLVIGLVSILGQVVLLRELSVAFYGVDLIYTLALGIWLLWTALGAAIGWRSLSPPIARVRRLFLLFALLLLPEVAFIRSIRVLFSDVPGAYLPFAGQILTMAAALLPAGVLSGLIFQWAAKAYLSRGHTLPAAYAIESAGGLAGGLCATLFLSLGARNLSIAVFCSCVGIGPALFVPGAARRGGRAAAAGLALLIPAILWFAGPLDHAMTAWSHPFLLDSQDSPYGRVTITRRAGQVAVYENDALSFETEGTDAEEFAQMAALLHPRPAHVLILGGGIGGTVREILKHFPDRVDYVELNVRLLSMAAQLLPPHLEESLRFSPVRVHMDDPRRYLALPASYDLILIGMPEPDSGQTNRYYTLEFFQLCASRLKQDGILAFRLKSAENLWTPQQTARACSIYQALRRVFPHIQVLPGTSNLFAASRLTLVNSPSVLASRLEARRIETRLVSAPYIHYLYENDRFARIARLLETEPALPNTDVRPICYSYTLMIWLSKFYPDLAFWDPAALASWSRSHPAAWWAAAGIVLTLFLLARQRPSWRRTLFVGMAGFMGMVLETLLVLHYQAKSGVLYQNIGALLMSFMAGLAFGSYAIDRWYLARAHKTPKACGPLVIGGFMVFSLAAGARVSAVSSGGLAETVGWLLAAGFLVSAAFAYASLAGVGDPRTVVAPLYAADLIGGCLGSLAGSLLLIPLAGLNATAAFMAPSALLAALLLKGGPHNEA
jgi:spermidine synthase